ncbi:MAG: hypothetical protein ACK4IS_09115 [Erythrobacter sp.]
MLEFGLFALARIIGSIEDLLKKLFQTILGEDLLGDCIHDESIEFFRPDAGAGARRCASVHPRIAGIIFVSSRLAGADCHA